MIPYKTSAAIIVPLRCVITINCVSFVSLCRYFANLVTFESSNAASISSRRQNGDGFKFWIANNNEIAVKAFSPPDNCIIFWSFFPGGCAMILIPDSNTSSSVSSNLASPPPNNSTNTSWNTRLMSLNFALNWRRIASSSSSIKPVRCASAVTISSCCFCINS